jgi:hypothetical protein
VRGVEVPHLSAHVVKELCLTESGFAITGLDLPVCTDELDEIVSCGTPTFTQTKLQGYLAHKKHPPPRNLQ